MEESDRAGPRRVNLVGTTVADRFEVLAFVAAGGMGHVYRARDKETGAQVALKLLAPVTGDAKRFEVEANALAKIDHPNVVRYVAHGETAEHDKYLAMEWLRGEDLADRLGEDGTLSVDEVLVLAKGVAAALDAAHRTGIVHRDLKPANVFLVDGRVDLVRVLDFGIARSVARSEITMTGHVVGTPAYMAPEQVRGETVGPPADVYGLGAVLHRCLTGSPPFRGAHPVAVLAKVIAETPAPARELRADVPRVLDALVSRMLAKDPAERPRDGAGVLEELSGVEATSALSEGRVRAVISGREQRLACVVLCADGGTANDATITEENAATTDAAVRSAVEELGGILDPLVHGAWLVTIPKAASPAERATRAVRCALALALIRPTTPIFVATGRVLVTGEGRVGEVIDRAADALVDAKNEGAPGGVRVDATTAELVAERFRTEGDGEWRTVAGEEEGFGAARTLLGKRALCIGRERELAMLDAVVSASLDGRSAGAAAIVAPAGLGKTHLVHELLRPTRGKHGAVDVIHAQGDPSRASTPYGVAVQLVKRAAGIREADGADVRMAKIAGLLSSTSDSGALHAELFAEMIGIELRAHRRSTLIKRDG